MYKKVLAGFNKELDEFLVSTYLVQFLILRLRVVSDFGDLNRVARKPRKTGWLTAFDRIRLEWSTGIAGLVMANISPEMDS